MKRVRVYVRIKMQHHDVLFVITHVGGLVIADSRMLTVVEEAENNRIR